MLFSSLGGVIAMCIASFLLSSKAYAQVGDITPIGYSMFDPGSAGYHGYGGINEVCSTSHPLIARFVNDPAYGVIPSTAQTSSRLRYENGYGYGFQTWGCTLSYRINTVYGPSPRVFEAEFTYGDACFAGAPYAGRICRCPPSSPRFNGTTCVAGETLVTLDGPTETRPAGTGGASFVTITATVTSGGLPKPAVAVEFSVDVVPNSGGHEHHDANRPRGQLSGTVGITPANGQVTVVLKAPEVAGIHKIKATCTGCASEAVHEITVKVPGLVELGADRSTPSTYTLRGADVRHASNHWFSASARIALIELIDVFNDLKWQPVGVNDASLKWGGRFDIKGNWAGSHAEHSLGEEVDISFAV